MDYPKSVPSVGLVNGKFVDENPITGTPGSLVPASWGNGVTQEILNVLAAAGIAPDETKTDQLAQALSVLSDWLKLKNKPTTLAGYGITDAMPAGAGGLLSSAAVVRGKVADLPASQFVTVADATTDRPATVSYGAGLHIKYPGGGYGFDLLSGVTSEWYGVRRLAEDGTGSWRMLWHDANFNPASKADKATTLAGYGITDALTVGQYGLGGNIAPSAAIDTVGLPGGFYFFGEGNSSFGQYLGLVNIPYGNGNYAGQLAFQQGNSETTILVRGCDNNGKWNPTRRLWHDGNLKSGDFLPVGTTIQYAGPSVPSGFLKENGAEVSRTVYARLFAAIGTFYGAGDGSTTFNLPDSRGEFIRGLDDGRGVDPQRALGSLQLDSMQGHWHGPRPGTSLNGSPGNWNGVGGGANATFNIGSTGDPVTNGVHGTPRTSSETRPRNTSRLMCIKY